MAIFALKRGPVTNLPSLAIEDGSFIVTTDEQKLYVDLGTKRYSLGDILVVDELPVVEDANASKFYFLTSNNCLYRVVEGEFVNISEAGVKVTTGATNGTINVNGTEVAVFGLAEAAFMDADEIQAKYHEVGSEVELNSITDVKQGDIAVVKALVAGSEETGDAKYSMTSFIYDSETWKALDNSDVTDIISGEVDALEGRVAELEEAIGADGSVADQIEAAVAELAEVVAGNKTATEEALATKADKATTLAGYGITDAYTKEEVDGKLSGALHFKGTVTYLSELPTTGQAQGDVYQVTYAVNEADYVAGTTVVSNSEFVWNGTEWEELGSIIDLSAYATKENVAAGLATKSDLGHTHESTEITDFANAVATVMADATAKLDGIEEGAQVNVIETVKVNGTALTVEGKAVNVEVPTGALASKDKVAETDLESTLAEKLNNKADKATTLAGYGITDAYTKEEADAKVATAKSEAINTAGTNADTKISTAVGTLAIGEQSYATVKDYVDAKAAAAQSAATYDDTQVKADIAANKSAIDVINNVDNGILAQAKGYADGLAVNYDEKGAAAAVQGNLNTLADEVAGVKATAEKAVVANAAIEGATHTKITYDSKGLVTGGSDLVVADIPELPTSKIAGLDTALAGKQENLTFDGSYVAGTNNVATVKTVTDAVAAEAVIARAAEKANADDIDALEGRMDTAEGKLTTLTGAANVAGSVAEAKAAADAAQADVDALEEKVGTVPTGKTVVQMISDAQTAATYDDTKVKEDIAANAAAIETLNASATTEGSVAKAVADAKSEVVGASTDAKEANTVFGAKAYADNAATVAVNGLDAQLKAVAKSGAAADVTIADAEGKIVATNVEGALTELATAIEANKVAGVVTVEKSTNDDYAAVYTIAQGGSTVGTINIPKDMVVENGEVVTLVAADDNGHEAGTYLKLVLANAANSEIWIPVGELIEYVTGGATTEITITVDPQTHVATAVINDASIELGKLSTGVQASLGKADSAVQSVTVLGKTLNQTTGELTVEEAKTALGLGSAAYVDTTTFDAAGSADAAKAAVIGASGDAKTADTVYGAKAFATDLNTAMDARVAELEAAVGEDGSVSTQITNAIEALDVTDTAVEGQYVSRVAQENGKVVVERVALPDYTEVYDAKGAAAAAQAAAEKHADDAVEALDGELAAVAKSGNAADVAIADAANNFETATNVETALVEVVAKIGAAQNAAVTSANAHADAAVEALDKELATVAKSGNAADVAIADAAGNYDATTVEAAFAEVVTKIGAAQEAAQGYADDAVEALDNELKAVAKSGNAADVAIADAAGNYNATTVEAAFTEVVGKINTAQNAAVTTANAYTDEALTWVEF